MPRSLDILLLQARDASDPARRDEPRQFAEKSDLSLERIHTHDLLQGPPKLREILRCDALMVGGSGDYYVSKRNLPDFRRLLDVLAEVAEVGHPTFASCFGFHLLTQALGGEIIHQPDEIEIGTYDLTLTSEGRADPLFGKLPAVFPAQVGHKDRADRLPEGVIHLASSDLCPYQAFRIGDRPIWATQFHPELDDEELRGRLMIYYSNYGTHLSPEEQKNLDERFRPSPDANRLIDGFLDLVFA